MAEYERKRQKRAARRAAALTLEEARSILVYALGEKDEHAVISECVAPPMERFDPSASGADKKVLAAARREGRLSVIGVQVGGYAGEEARLERRAFLVVLLGLFSKDT